MSDESLPLIRPIPRRPFDLNLTSPTPPDDDSDPAASNPDFSSARFLNPPYHGSAGASDSGSLSRTQSILNLTSSALFGIFSPTIGSDRFSLDRDEPNTPWGTGAQTPVKRHSVDDTTFELMKERSNTFRKGSPYPPVPVTPSRQPVVVLLSLAVRIGVLFLLGMGYGALLARLRVSIATPGYDWNYLAVWGVVGVALGALLPWFDGVWESAFGSDAELEGALDKVDTKEPGSLKDWTSVVRSIATFVGIIFAIRKLPWDSALQVSITLALVNPFLWYLIDRSLPGFILSAAVGVMGSAVLIGVNPDIMPTPSATSFLNSSSYPHIALSGLVTQKTAETGIWMVSVLFCCSVCFGNIGRRLALSKTAATKGRWRPVR